MTNTGALLFDGASRRKALIWLSQTFPSHSLAPLLYGTQYEALGDVGPILIDADEGSPLQKAWSQGLSDLQHAVWLKTTMNQSQLYLSLRRRLRVLSPDGREFWLRLADARPLLGAWQAGAQWPDGFWHGVSEVWLPHQDGKVMAWENSEPGRDCAPTAKELDPGIVLGWPLLEALAREIGTMQEAAL